MHKFFKFLGIGVLALSLAIGVAGFNPVDAAGYLKIGDIKGESADNEHKDWIIIESMSSSIEKTASLSGNRQLKPLSITISVDKASPMLQRASTSGQAIPVIIMDVEQAYRGQTTVVRYKLHNVTFTSSTASGRSAATQTISLNYSRVERIKIDKMRVSRNY